MPATCGSSRTRSTSTRRRSRTSSRARTSRCARASGRFLGYAYVNPHTLISARLLGRDPDYPPGKSLLVHRLKVALALRKRFYARAVLPARLRRGRPAAGPRRRSLRRRARRADRHGRHGGHEGGDPGGARQGRRAARAPVEERFAGARARGPAALRRDGLRRGAGCRRGARGRRELPRAARGGTEDRLVLRPDRQSRAVRAPRAAARACSTSSATPAASRLQASAPGRASVTCVDSSAAGARPQRRRRPRPTGSRRSCSRAMPSTRSRRCVAERRRFDAVVVDPPAFIKRKKDHPKGLAAYRRINQLAMQLLDRDGLLMSCSCSLSPGAGRAGRRRPACRTPSRSLRAAGRGRRAVAGPPGAPGDRRDALPARLPVPGHRLMLAYPEIDPVAFALGPVKVHWYGLMYVRRLRRRLVARAPPRGRARLDLEAGGRRRPHLLRRDRRDPRRPPRLDARSTASTRILADPLDDHPRLAGRHVVPRRPRRRHDRRRVLRLAPRPAHRRRVRFHGAACPRSASSPGGSATSSTASSGASRPTCPGACW